MELVYGLGGIVIIIAVIAATFTIVREITLWYFRFGEMADNLKVIADHYRQVDSASAGAQPPAQPKPAPMQRPRFDPMTGQPVGR